MKILGVEYALTHKGELRKQDCDGMCYTYSKKIEIVPVDEMLEDCDGTVEKKLRYNEVLRHEIIHAFYLNQEGKIGVVVKPLLIILQFSFQSFLNCSMNIIVQNKKGVMMC